MTYPYHITARQPEAIKMDVLEGDINSLLVQNVLTEKDLTRWCEQITAVSDQLEKLYKQVECILPHKTDGQCYRLDIGPNRLLSVILSIQDTQVGFNTMINITKERIVKTLENKQEKIKAETKTIVAQEQGQASLF